MPANLADGNLSAGKSKSAGKASRSQGNSSKINKTDRKPF